MPTRPSNHPQLAVTDAHRRAAFEAMGWKGWTFEQAMADDVRSKVVNSRARHLCNAEAQTMRRVPLAYLSADEKALVAKVAQRWSWAKRRSTQAPAPLPKAHHHQQDLKRAASGDRDED
jgi:hypothetical protein